MYNFVAHVHTYTQHTRLHVRLYIMCISAMNYAHVTSEYLYSVFNRICVKRNVTKKELLENMYIRQPIYLIANKGQTYHIFFVVLPTRYSVLSIIRNAGSTCKNTECKSYTSVYRNTNKNYNSKIYIISSLCKFFNNIYHIINISKNRKYFFFVIIYIEGDS